MYKCYQYKSQHLYIININREYLFWNILYMCTYLRNNLFINSSNAGERRN